MVHPKVTKLESGLRPSSSWAACPGSCCRPSVVMEVGCCSGTLCRGGSVLERTFWRGCAGRFFNFWRSGSFFVGLLSEQSGVSPTVTEGHTPSHLIRRGGSIESSCRENGCVPSVVMYTRSWLVETMSGGGDMLTSVSWGYNSPFVAGELHAVGGRRPAAIWPVLSVFGSRGFGMFAPRLAA